MPTRSSVPRAQGGGPDSAAAPRTSIPRGPPEGQADRSVFDDAADYDFLRGRLVDKATLQLADDLARLSNTTINSVLISLGWVDEGPYVAVLSRFLGIAVAGAAQLDVSGASGDGRLVDIAAIHGDPDAVAVRATAFTPRELVEWLHAEPSMFRRMRLASTADFQNALVARFHPHIVDRAVRGLQRFDRDLSAKREVATWQRLGLVVFAGMPIGGAIVDPFSTLEIFSIILAVPFACVVLLRTSSLVALLLRSTGRPERTLDISDAELPTYSILVPLPLYKETEVLPRLILSLSRLDYPTPKLEILLVLESTDHETSAAVARQRLPGCFRVVVVPPGEPRTKPRALNYALQLARGTYVVVFDAEDRPEPTQLRAAVARFARGGPNLACVQARLNTYNPNASLLTRGLMAQTPGVSSPWDLHFMSTV
jgi:glycosyltransferase XagB